MYRILTRSAVKASSTFDLIEASQHKQIKHSFRFADSEKQVAEEVTFAKSTGYDVVLIVDRNLKDVTEQFTAKAQARPLHVGNIGGKYGDTVAIYADGTAFYNGEYFEVDDMTTDWFETDGKQCQVTFWAYTTMAHKQNGKYKPVKETQFDSQSVYDYETTYTICKECNLILDIETKIVNDEDEDLCA